MFRAVASGLGYPSRFMAVGYLGAAGIIQSSLNGETWISRTPGSPPAAPLNGVAWYYQDRYMAVGELGEIQWTSNSGALWTKLTPAAAYAGTFYGVAALSSIVVVAVGQAAEIQMWTPGPGWTHYAPADAFAGTFYCAASDYSGRAVIAGSGGEIQYYDLAAFGDEWFHAEPDRGFADYWLGACYANGFFWLVGSNGELQQSRDGITWRRVTNNMSNVFTRGVCGDGLEGILVCNDNQDIYARTRVGPEMLFNALTFPAGSLDLHGITVYNEIAVCVGQTNTILRATRYGS